MSRTDESHWNWRVARCSDDDGNEWYRVIEVYYDTDGEVAGWGPPVAPIGNTVEDLRGELDLMMQAFDRPIFIRLTGGVR